MATPSLKVVQEEQVDPLTGFEPLLLSSVDLLDTYWLQTAVVLQPVVEKAMNGEMTLDDIYDGIKAGRIYCVIAKRDVGEIPEVAIAIAMQIVIYPQFSVLDIIALGGRQLNLFKSKFWQHLCSWAFMNGIRTMEASVSPAMARILKGYGFEQVYVTVRKPLTEM